MCEYCRHHKYCTCFNNLPNKGTTKFIRVFHFTKTICIQLYLYLIRAITCATRGETTFTFSEDMFLVDESNFIKNIPMFQKVRTSLLYIWKRNASVNLCCLAVAWRHSCLGPPSYFEFSDHDASVILFIFCRNRMLWCSITLRRIAQRCAVWSMQVAVEYFVSANTQC